MGMSDEILEFQNPCLEPGIGVVSFTRIYAFIKHRDPGLALELLNFYTLNQRPARISELIAFFTGKKDIVSRSLLTELMKLVD